MEKPQKKVIEVYDLLSITEYVSEKYNLNLDDNDVWHWFVESHEPNNGSKICLNTDINSTDKDWVKGMKNALEKEFGKSILLIVEW